MANVHIFSPHHSPSFSSSSLSSSSSSFEQDEDYIDLEVSSHSIFHSSTTSLNNSSRDFEFQMTSSLSIDMDPTADQLFYNGKLLPLQKLLHENQQQEEQELYSTPFATPPSTPIVGCHVSNKIVSEDYVADYFAEEEAVEFGGDRSSTKMWTRKIKEMIRQSLFKTKLKIPKSLFGKSGCSHQSSCATTSLYQGSKDRVPKRHSKVMWIKDSIGSTSSSSSSSTSTATHSTRLSEIQLLQRLHESPIQGAIKHCKQSQYLGTTKPYNMI